MMRFGKRGLNLAANAAVTAATKVRPDPIRSAEKSFLCMSELARCHVSPGMRRSAPGAAMLVGSCTVRTRSSFLVVHLSL